MLYYQQFRKAVWINKAAVSLNYQDIKMYLRTTKDCLSELRFSAFSREKTRESSLKGLHWKCHLSKQTFLRTQCLTSGCTVGPRWAVLAARLARNPWPRAAGSRGWPGCYCHVSLRWLYFKSRAIVPQGNSTLGNHHRKKLTQTCSKLTIVIWKFLWLLLWFWGGSGSISEGSTIWF